MTCRPSPPHNSIEEHRIMTPRSFKTSMRMCTTVPAMRCLGLSPRIKPEPRLKSSMESKAHLEQTKLTARSETHESQLGQSNRSITDGPAECDNHPSPTGQRTRPTFHEFGVGNDWAEWAMCRRWAARKRAPHTGKKWVSPLWQGFMAPMHCAHWSFY